MSYTKAYKVGIGITSYNRPEMLDKCLKHIYDYSASHQLYVAVDTNEDRKGVAYRKNECLIALQNCDHIFLFDDDAWPIDKGWEEFFINSQENHLLYLNDKLHSYYDSEIKYKDKGKEGVNDAVVLRYYKDCGGVFMYITKEALSKVGAFNEEFDTWGFEHAEWSIRILGQHGKYPMLAGTSEYIYSEDYSNTDHKSSITNEEKNFYFNKNKYIFAKPISTIYRPL